MLMVWWLALLACSGAPVAEVTSEPVPPQGQGPDVLVADGAPAGGDTMAALRPGPCAEGSQGGMCARGIAGGTFLQGAQATDPKAPGYDPDARSDESPVRQVTISPFWMFATEVSAYAVARCLDAGVCKPDGVLTGSSLATVGVTGKGDHPAVGVDWHTATAFCEALGGRLPTEAEWEWVARGEAQRRFPWGNQARCPVRAGSAGDTTQAATQQGPTQEEVDAACGAPRERLFQHFGAEKVQELAGSVGELLTSAQMIEMCQALAPLAPEKMAEELVARRKAAEQAAPVIAQDTSLSCNMLEVLPLADADQLAPMGVVALAGSVWEWTSDVYAADAYATGPVTDPKGAAEGDTRVQRGGSFMSEDLTEFRAAARAQLPPDMKLPDVGFRCVWDEAPSPE